MCLPYAHYVLAYFVPMAFFSSMYGESLIFGFVSCILRYHATAHRVLERALTATKALGACSLCDLLRIRTLLRSAPGMYM